MPDLAETIITTLTSGVLTAVGAYSAVVWKLTRRVVILEEKIGALDKKTEELRKAGDALEDRHNDLRVELTQEVATLKEELTAQLVESSHNILKRLDEISTKLSEDMGDFRTRCSDRTSRYLSKGSFEQYTKEEERRWQEFYKAIGKLEVVIEKTFRGTSIMPKKPPPDGDGS